jgi:hypothetical protein
MLCFIAFFLLEPRGVDHFTPLAHLRVDEFAELGGQRVHPAFHLAVSARSNRRDRRAFFVLSRRTIDTSRLSDKMYFYTYLSSLPMNAGRRSQA